jgi:hypothetical protein
VKTTSPAYGYREGVPLWKEAVMLASSSRRGSHFLALPSTRLGQASAWLFAAGFVVWVATLFIPRGTDLSVGPVDPIALLMLIGFVGALFTGAVALIGYHERSWTVWVATLLPILVIAADVVVGLLVGGE